MGGGERVGKILHNNNTKTPCKESQCIHRGSKRGCRKQKRRITRHKQLRRLQLQEKQKSDTCSWRQNTVLALAPSCSTTQSFSVALFPPLTEGNIGVESAPLEGHMWPHSQLIRVVRFLYSECSHVRVKWETASDDQSCDVLVGRAFRTPKRRRYVSAVCWWNCGFSGSCCVPYCSPNIIHGLPGTEHRTGR